MTRSFFECWLAPAVLAALALTLYLLTLSDVHTFDALSYIRDVDGRTGFFFHPHHLLYSPTGWLFWQSWRIVGYRGNSELALKVLNALAGAGCGFGLYRLTYHLTRQVPPALIAAGIFLFSYATWYFSAEVEVYLLALVWLLLALALLIELVTAPRPRTAPLLGFAVGAAALYHQTNGLLVPVVVLAVALAPLPLHSRLRVLAICALVAGGLVALGYAVVGFGVNGYRTLGQLRDWMFFFVETGWWGHATRDRMTDLGAGLGNTLSTQGALPYWIGIVALLLLGFSAARRWPRIAILCAFWIVLYGAFFIWWEAENIEFWIATLLPLWLLLGLAVASIRPWWAARPASAVALAGVGLLAWHNYPLVERRGDAAFDLQRQLSAGVRQVTTPNDLILAPGGVMELYLPYYEERPNIRTLNGVLFQTGGNVEQAFARLSADIATSLHAGLAVVVGREMMQLPPEIFRRYDVPQERLDAFWRPYREAMQPAVVHKGETYFWRIPAAQEVAQDTGWRWSSFDWGWQASNVTAGSFDGKWCFDPRPDPALNSPVLRLDTAPVQAMEVTLSTLAAGQTAQFFYAGPDGSLS
ncbi:MAG: glycosyltransferase family 39 protein, partial [Chloroflexota bacterium]|nr:glycosyltransferase family 39 protein [Chloroflexota bacterium]